MSMHGSVLVVALSFAILPLQVPTNQITSVRLLILDS